MISFLPGLKSAGGTEEILRNTIGERVLGLPPEPRLDKASHSQSSAPRRPQRYGPRTLRRAGVPPRGRPRRALALQDARGRARRSQMARASCPTCWPVACEAGWPGLLVDDAHGGAGLDAFDAMLVLGECGVCSPGSRSWGTFRRRRSLAIPRSMPRGPSAGLASGRAALPICPPVLPNDIFDSWCIDPAHGAKRPLPPVRPPAGDGHVTVSGTFSFVPDAPGADVLVGVALLDGKAVGVAIKGTPRASPWRASAAMTPPARSGTSRSPNARAALLDVSEESLAAAWYLAQALLAAESVGRSKPRSRSPSPMPRSGIPLGARSAPIRLSSTRSPRCSASRRTAARCSTTPAGLATDPPGSSRLRLPLRGRLPGTRWIRLRAR